MTIAGATKEELAAFDELYEKHAKDIRNRLDSFKNQGKLPDDEFEQQICASYKKELKNRVKYIIQLKRNKA